MQEKIEEFSSISQRLKLSSTKTSGLLCYKDKRIIRKPQKIPKCGKILVSCYLGVVFATPCHPMATGLAIVWQNHAPYSTRVENNFNDERQMIGIVRIMLGDNPRPYPLLSPRG